MATTPDSPIHQQRPLPHVNYPFPERKMAAFGSPLKRLGILTTVGVAALLIGTKPANAQSGPGAYASPADTIRYYGNGERPASSNTYTGSYNGTSGRDTATTIKPIVVDTAENRRFANQIYKTAFVGIDKVFQKQGKDAALDYSQHPEQNSALMSLVKQAKEGQLEWVALIIAHTMTDAPAYINGNQKGVIPSLSNTRWAGTVSDVQPDINKKNPNLSEREYLENGLKTGESFGPKSTYAVRLVISSQPVTLASLERRP